MKEIETKNIENIVISEVESVVFLDPIKNNLNYVQAWSKFNKIDMPGVLSIELNSTDYIKNKYENLKKDNHIKLYMIIKNFIAYSPFLSNMYELEEEDLFKIAHENGYIKFDFPINSSNEDKSTYIKCVNSAKRKVIPLKNCFLLQSDKLFNITIKNNIFIGEWIK